MFLKKLFFVPLAAAVLSAAVPVLTFALGSSDKDERTVEEILKDGTRTEISKYLKKHSKALHYTTPDQTKDTILHIAIKARRDADIIKDLLSFGAEPMKKNALGQTPIMYLCAYTEDTGLLDTLIRSGTVFKIGTGKRVLETDSEGKTAFDYALGKPRMIAVLEKYARRPQSNIIAEQQAAEAAVAAKEAELQAIEAQKKLEAEKAQEELAIRKAAEEKRLADEAAAAARAAEEAKIISFQANENAEKIDVQQFEPTYLFDVEYEAPPVVPVAAAEPLPEDKADKNGVTSLMVAARNGRYQTVSQLIAGGANVNRRDADGWTPLMYSVRFSNDVSVVSLLLDSGADIHAVNNYGATALSTAALFSSNPEILQLLLKNKSSTQAETREAFVLAIKYQRPLPIIQSFISSGLPLNQLYDGLTPLMHAARTNTNTGIISLLLKSGAKTNILSKDKKTAFDYALSNSQLPRNDTYYALQSKRTAQ